MRKPNKHPTPLISLYTHLLLLVGVYLFKKTIKKAKTITRTKTKTIAITKYKYKVQIQGTNTITSTTLKPDSNLTLV